MKMIKCEKCNKELKGLMISTGTGVACESCYYANNPYIKKESFYSVLVNIDDQVLVRQLIDKYMPPEIKQWVIDDFNETMTKRYDSRLSS